MAAAMLPSLSGLTLKDRPVATTGVNPDEPGSPSGAKPFETEADAMMDELKDIENSVERANQASANALQAVQSATTAKQAYQKLSREAERAQKRHQKAMEQEIEEGLDSVAAAILPKERPQVPVESVLTLKPEP